MFEVDLRGTVEITNKVDVVRKRRVGGRAGVVCGGVLSMRVDFIFFSSVVFPYN